MNGRGEISSISLEDFFLLQQSGKALIIDARPAVLLQPRPYPGSHQPARKTIATKRLPRRESEIKTALAAGKTIVVYCTSLTCPDARHRRRSTSPASATRSRPTPAAGMAGRKPACLANISLTPNFPTPIMTSFSNVTVDAKANVYFDGKVVSHTVHFPDGPRKPSA